MNELLDALGYVGSSLGKPGRAVRGLLGGRPDEAAAIIPFSDAMGITDPSRELSGQDLLKQTGLDTGTEWGNALLGFGAETALDPLTYAGGFLGRLGGKALGRGMETAAKLRGPGYATEAGNIADMLKAAEPALSDKDFAWHLARTFDDHAPQAFSEIHPGSKIIGDGGEALAFQSPGGQVVRIGPGGDAMGRPAAAPVLQPTRTVDFGGGPDVRVEHSPFADKVGDTSYWLGGGREMGRTRLGDVRADARAAGLDFLDPHPGNVGLVNGEPRIIDSGAIAPEVGYAGGFAPVITPSEPSAMMRALLSAGGGQPAMQRSLEAGLAAPRYERQVGRAGLGLGAVAPSLFPHPQQRSLQ